MRLLLACLVLLGWQPSLAVGQVIVDEEFDSGNVWTNWCPCQVDMENAPVTFPFDTADPKKRIARIEVNDFSLGGNQCFER